MMSPAPWIASLDNRGACAHSFFVRIVSRPFSVWTRNPSWRRAGRGSTTSFASSERAPPGSQRWLRLRTSSNRLRSLAQECGRLCARLTLETLAVGLFRGSRDGVSCATTQHVRGSATRGSTRRVPARSRRQSSDR